MKSTYFGFSIAAAIYVAATVTWYVTLPHLSSLGNYALHGMLLVCGFMAALLDKMAYLRRAIALGVLMAVINGLLHWIFALAGFPVDAGTWDGALVVAVFSMPICIGLSVVGGLAGQFVAVRKASAQRAKEDS